MPKETWGDLEGSFGGGVRSLPLSPKERDYAARTVVAEAGGDPMGQAAVMHVIRNRALHGGFGEGVHGVITKPYAFEPWLHAGTGRRNDPLAFAADDARYQQALRVVDAVANGEIPDPTRGATHFYSPSAQRQLASLDNRALVPNWAKPEARTAVIGGQEFYNLADSTGKPKRVIPITRGGEETVPADYDWMGEARKEWQGRQEKAPMPPPPAFMQDAQKEWDQRPVAPLTPSTIPQAPQDWGAGRSFATGVTLGAFPKMEAGIEAAGKYLTGNAPSFLEERNRRLGELQKGREQYQAYAPITHMLAEQGGALLGTALPMYGAARGAAMGAQALGRALPAARPGIEAAGRFLAGETGKFSPGFLAGAQRAGSYAAQGAVQGAGQAALTQGLQPDEQGFGSGVAKGALGGAIMGSFVNPLMSGLAAPLGAEIAPNVRALALKVNDKFGLNLRPTQVARNAEVNALDRRVIPQHVADEQVVKFNEELGKQLGMHGKELTKENVHFEMRKVGQDLSDIAAQSVMRPTRNFFRDLGAIRSDVYATTIDSNPLRAKVDSILMKIYNESSTGFMDGKKFRDITKKDGLLDRELGNTQAEKVLGYKIKEKLFDMFEISDPQRASAYAQARHMYRKLMAVEPMAGPSGIVDPTALLKRTRKFNLTGDVQELAEAGQFMPRTTKSGSARLPPKPTMFEHIKDLGRAASPAYPTAIAYGLNIAPGAVGAASALLGGGQYIGAKVRDFAMANPTIGKMALQGRLPNVVTPGENVLARGASNVAAQVGAGSERRKRK